MSKQRSSSFATGWPSPRQIAGRAGRRGGPFAYVSRPSSATPSPRPSCCACCAGRRRGPPCAFGLHGRRARYPAGTHVVLLAQPFRVHVKDLLEVQHYPDRRHYPGGPPIAAVRPRGLDAAAPDGRRCPHDRLAVPDRRAGEGRLGRDAGLRRRGAERRRGRARRGLEPGTFRAIFEVLRDGGRVTFAGSAFEAGGQSWPAGTPVVSGVAGARRARGTLGAGAGRRRRSPGRAAGRRPDDERLRVALYKPWTASMDEGWTRWLFEQWGVPFDTVDNPVVRAGGLGARYDAIVVPAISYRQLMDGYGGRAHPDTRAASAPRARPRSRRSSRAAARSCCWTRRSSSRSASSASRLATSTPGRPATRRAGWYAPGSLLKVEWNRSHPLASGMPEESAVFYARSPVFEVAPNAQGVTVIARYPEANRILLEARRAARGEDRGPGGGGGGQLGSGGRRCSASGRSIARSRTRRSSRCSTPSTAARGSGRTA